MSFTCLCFLLSTLLTYVKGQGCEPYKNFPQHSMCIYKAGACTSGYTIINKGLDSSQQQKMVQIHNKLRTDLVDGSVKGQPRAKYMANMTWDSELATIAQRTADQCIFAHDKMRNVARFRVGQNIYINSRKPIDKNLSPDMKTAALGWWNEVYKPGFDPKNINPFVFSKGAGHYTQMAWAKTSKIGCGYTMYKSTDNWSYKLLFCNYGPGGNVIGTTMYDTA